MKLGELEVGTEIDIEVKIGSKEWLFHATILQFIKGVALMEPISHEGKVINLAGDDVGVSVYVNDEEDIPNLQSQHGLCI